MGWNQPSAALTGSLNPPLGVFESRITPAQGGGCSVQEAITKRSKNGAAGKGKGPAFHFCSLQMVPPSASNLPDLWPPRLWPPRTCCNSVRTSRNSQQINFCSRLDIPWLKSQVFSFKIIYTYCNKAWKETLEDDPYHQDGVFFASVTYLKNTMIFNWIRNWPHEHGTTRSLMVWSSISTLVETPVVNFNSIHFEGFFFWRWKYWWWFDGSIFVDFMDFIHQENHLFQRRRVSWLPKVMVPWKRNARVVWWLSRRWWIHI